MSESRALAAGEAVKSEESEESGEAELDSAEGFVTLTAAADLLQVDIKTLRRKLEAFGIVTRADPSDRRSSLLSQEQIETLRTRLRQSQRKRGMRSPAYVAEPLFSGAVWREFALAQAEAAAREKEEILRQREDRMSAREKALDQATQRLQRLVDEFIGAYKPSLDRLVEMEKQLDAKRQTNQPNDMDAALRKA